MGRGRRWKAGIGWILVSGVALGFLLPLGGRALLFTWEDNPLLRGRNLAQENGCLSCHLPYGEDEIPNPGSRWGTVPRFRGGNAMMYTENRQEIEEFIRHGAPLAWLEDPAVSRRLKSQAVRMPAYGDRLDDRQISDLTAYVCAQEGIDLPGGSAVEAGRSLARRHGCLSCHGGEGAGGLPNPGSLAGFIPGFRGKNFRDLVRDETEFTEWVRTGTVQRLADHPVASFFWRRQKISMPAYADTLGEEDIAHLWAWVSALQEASR